MELRSTDYIDIRAILEYDHAELSLTDKTVQFHFCIGISRIEGDILFILMKKSDRYRRNFMQQYISRATHKMWDAVPVHLQGKDFKILITSSNIQLLKRFT